jgi:hypothetical protein
METEKGNPHWKELFGSETDAELRCREEGLNVRAEELRHVAERTELDGISIAMNREDLFASGLFAVRLLVPQPANTDEVYRPLAA